ncbi:glutaredoxin family protein [Larsenimonas suaedae]|uniref:Glutathione S-transferase N-terminal domain-containing protein n=1 Tax=Larsenimonas suaedae TaxID=1851019 RepID=A0ABU1GWN1_9GAMM|nr:glutathione S-transferase N-terminal domain-containing protein [Larsenimonas suaedae]MCM2973023.1 glutathione S-transferase N-terminal domain-containing protein [Larsenimonas suaedae]MDR5896460.1 glutathione S-transferase N-terminal domain-containing protein [Larsenimonas suaedae]
MNVVIRFFFRALRRLLMPFMLAYAALSKPKPVTRSKEEQAKVDAACRQLTLYQFASCPFCIKVKKQIHGLALPISMKNTQKDAGAREELERGGGRVKVPCLKIVHDGGREEWMYESDDINRYLKERFAV